MTAMNTNQEDFNRSEEIQEIIARKPHFLDNWGLFSFMLLLMIIFVASSFIHYPVVIQSNATLTAENAPKEIVARTDGKLVRLFVHNDSKILQGETIGWLESTGNHQEIISLDASLDSSIALLQLGKTERVFIFYANKFNDLGELQSSYQQFYAAYQQFSDYLVNGYYYKRKKNLLWDLSFLKKMH